MLSEAIKKKILDKLIPLNPHKIILFGSYANGLIRDDSDLDLYIVSNENFMPSSYRQNMNHYKKYAKLLSDIKKKYPMDLIIHTLPMHKKFVQMESSFSKEILTNGIYLYEAN